MKEYSKVLEFYFDKQKYVMLLDDNNKHFFLKQNKDGSVGYLNFIEFFNLVEVLNQKPIYLAINDDKNARKKRKKFKFIPKLIVGNLIVGISISSLGLAYQMFKNYKKMTKYTPASSISSSYTSESKSSSTTNDSSDSRVRIDDDELTFEDVKKYVSQEDEKTNEESEVDTFYESSNGKQIFVYDNDYLDKIFPDIKKEDVTAEVLKKAVKWNFKISSRFKPLIYEYIDALTSKYPNGDYRPFYKNLKTMEIVECTQTEMLSHSVTYGASGCYVRSENKIYVLKDKTYEKKTWDYQVIYHELSHAMRTCTFKENGVTYKAQFEGLSYYNTVIDEAINSVFSVSLFDYKEEDIAYQLQSNYLRVILSCMDNYSLNDYINKNTSYFAKKLGEYNNDGNYAKSILELIAFQYKDFHSSSIKTTKDAYYPIYDYICKMYFNKNIKEGMSYDEAYGVYEEMMRIITFDVSDDYNLDVDRFYNNFVEFCKGKNISVNIKSR